MNGIVERLLAEAQVYATLAAAAGALATAAGTSDFSNWTRTAENYIAQAEAKLREAASH